MSVRRVDAIRFGGFDEHPSFRGYLCGPYDLGWRLVNAGIPEIWHDERVTLWHFAHPEPNSPPGVFSVKRWREITHPHLEYHALTAVEAFSTGRLLPLKENPEVHKLRMSLRQIGTRFEKRYARMTGPAGFSWWERLKLHLLLLWEPFRRRIPRRLFSSWNVRDRWIRRTGRAVAMLLFPICLIDAAVRRRSLERSLLGLSGMVSGILSRLVPGAK